MDAILNTRPSRVESNWKSTAHTTFGCVGVGDQRGGGPVAFARIADLDSQVSFAPQSLDLLAVDDHPLGP